MNIYSKIIGLDPQEVFANNRISLSFEADQYGCSNQLYKVDSKFIDFYYKRERKSQETWVACDVKIKESMIAKLVEELSPILKSKKFDLQDLSKYQNEEIIFSEELEDKLQFRMLKQDNGIFLCFTKFIDN